ncbi:hypothetical protein BIW11_04858 [Tropilaelaps mercedesae]|nr:hypothetical protein BIW11_04858 [Tropilaelaps mercedesae]
MDRQEAS